MRFVLILFLNLSLFGGSCLAQSTEETLFNRKQFRYSGSWIGTSYQFANFSAEEWVPLRGTSLGVEFNRELYLGWMRTSSREQITLSPNDPTYSFRYQGLIIGVAPGAMRWIHPRFGLTAGPARVWRNSEEGDDRLFIFQPQVGLELNVFQFARLTLDGGYRFAGQSSTYGLAAEQLSTPFIQVEIRFGFSWADNE
ncbi:MAG: hypothetical protein AAGJ82_14080 [Bacteroidota bacterium]